jgi:hypothetical protein
MAGKRRGRVFPLVAVYQLYHGDVSANERLYHETEERMLYL